MKRNRCVSARRRKCNNFQFLFQVTGDNRSRLLPEFVTLFNIFFTWKAFSFQCHLNAKIRINPLFYHTLFINRENTHDKLTFMF